MPDLQTRRHFIFSGAMVLAGAATGCATRPEKSQAAQSALGKSSPLPSLRFGLVTDIHYGEKNPDGPRVYRDSLAKMQSAVAALNTIVQQDHVGLAFAVMLGDFVDFAGDDCSPPNIATETGWLRAIEAEWAKVNTARHYVLGNHCVFTLTKEEFFANTQARPAPYSFDIPFVGARGAVHFVVLDACFTSAGAPYGRRQFSWADSNLPASELQWLADDLAKTPNPAIILVHQRLDGDTTNGAGDFQIKNAAATRAILEKSGKVLAVLQGHWHQNYLSSVNNIPYCVFRAMVEEPGLPNNAYCTVEVFPDYSIAIRGNFRQSSYTNLAQIAHSLNPVLPKAALTGIGAPEPHYF
ncbi:MAG TPA: metallophosphoesterase, partial [Opitutales bacterium]|nr:metallophosphoesterase [Opitutales bacterium]